MIIVHLKKDGIKMEKGMALASEDVNVVLKKNKWRRNTRLHLNKKKENDLIFHIIFLKKGS